MNKKGFLIFVFLFSLIFYLSPKGLIIESKDASNRSFEDYNALFKQCPFEVKVSSYQYRLAHYVSFTIVGGNTILANFTLEGVTGEYLCLSDGILLYAYYPGDPLGDTSMLFLDYNLTKVWERKFSGMTLPQYYENDTLFFIKHGSYEQGVKSCIYVVNATTGGVITEICPSIPGGFVISNVKIIEDGLYFVATYVETKFLWVRTNGDLYLIEESNVRKARVASIDGSALGAGFWVDANDKYVAVAYFLANEGGKQKNGLCVFTSKHLVKIACKRLDKTPDAMKLEDRMVYIKFRNGSVGTYKIIAP
ncbi:hypothetical protein K1720_00990 [Thermococcus argininiproducens]|uniref:Uncharacterized protein n=1 Tax=Thermococcus argininiproducens TaxID=2866384 RepID=A0A9E7MAK7_9EURY|nr:hypothetical protein [Thermococcus argininiproducens]USH00094.1 hypothetical protein K1720_00990 [Thermococcus argininiproducens]